MAKKKNNQTVVNNIESINLNINCDELAEAIVKAQNRAQEIHQSNPTKTKIKLKDFFKAIWLILCNKADTQGELTASLFSLMINLVFKFVALLCVIVFCMVIFVAIQCIKQGFEAGNEIWWYIASGFLFVVAIVVLLYTILIWGASNEVEKEKDRNYIVSVFSGIVSFAALIIAVIALAKEVG